MAQIAHLRLLDWQAVTVSDGPPENSPLLQLLSTAEPCVESVDAQLYVRLANTGAKPLLFRCSDGKSYWSKWPDNPHGNLSLFNELVVAGVGGALGAPFRPVKLVEVSDELVADLRIDGQRLPGGTYIGSELLEHSEESTEVSRVASDGNRERYPFLLAVFDLCLGDDMQLLHDQDDDQAVWSIDHGLWFWSTEGDWSPATLASMMQSSGMWGARPRGLSVEALLQAADGVDHLKADDLAPIWASTPTAWGIDDEHRAALLQFVLDRRSGVSGRLRSLSSYYARTSS